MAKYPRVGGDVVRQLWVGALLASTACAHRAGPTAEERLASTVAALDAAWAARGRVGLEATMDVLTALDVVDRTHPAIRWREARYEVAHGLSATARDEALQAFARARQVASACVEATRASEAARGRAAGVDASCAAWAALASTRWMVAFGPDAAAIDRARVRDWARWAGEAEPAAMVALALLEATHRQDASSLRSLPVATARQVAGPWVLWEDVRRFDAAAPPPDALPATPEDQAAWERSQAATARR